MDINVEIKSVPTKLSGPRCLDEGISISNRKKRTLLRLTGRRYPRPTRAVELLPRMQKVEDEALQSSLMHRSDAWTVNWAAEGCGVAGGEGQRSEAG
jgi:hypothetical protein